jgi:hypothetical protein
MLNLFDNVINEEVIDNLSLDELKLLSDILNKLERVLDGKDV